MADLLDRLSGDVGDAPAVGQGKLPVHQFFAALMAIADGQLTQAQVKTAFDIQAGQQTTDFNTIVSYYTAAVDKEKYLQRLHTIFMLSEYSSFNNAFTKGEINQWLSDVSDGTI